MHFIYPCYVQENSNKSGCQHMSWQQCLIDPTTIYSGSATLGTCLYAKFGGNLLGDFFAICNTIAMATVFIGTGQKLDRQTPLQFVHYLTVLQGKSCKKFDVSWKL